MKFYHFSSISLLPKQLKEGLQAPDVPMDPPMEFHGPLLFESPKSGLPTPPEIRYTIEIPKNRSESLKWVKVPTGSAYVYIGKEGVISEWIVLIEKLTRNHQYQWIGIMDLTEILKAASVQSQG